MEDARQVCSDSDVSAGWLPSMGARIPAVETAVVFSSAVPPGSGAFQMPTRPSAAAAASTLRGGKGQSQKRFSNFFSFFA